MLLQLIFKSPASWRSVWAKLTRPIVPSLTSANARTADVAIVSGQGGFRFELMCAFYPSDGFARRRQSTLIKFREFAPFSSPSPAAILVNIPRPFALGPERRPACLKPAWSDFFLCAAHIHREANNPPRAGPPLTLRPLSGSGGPARRSNGLGEAGEWFSGPQAKIGDFDMAQSLGTVTNRDQGGFEGTLSLMAHKTRITIIPNEAKENDRQPDYRIYVRREVV